MRNGELQTRFLRGVLHDLYEFQDRNTDYTRFEVDRRVRVKRQFKEKLLALIRNAGFVRCNYTEVVADRVDTILDNLEHYEATYQLLNDDYSKRLLVDLLKYRALGNRYVKLPSNNPRYWRALASIDKHHLEKRRTVRAWVWYLDRYDLGPSFGSIRLDCHKLNVLDTFLLEQYRYGHGRAIEAEPGDVVIDGGGCWGDTALYFAHKVGRGGRVFCFEFLPSNVAILRSNLERNPGPASVIEVVEQALWSSSGEQIAYSDNGPGTALGVAGENVTTTASIDDVLAGERLDFLKLDVEGSESDALRGAEQTLRRCRPKLAISVYHREDDICMIPAYLDGLGLGYEFYLDHFTIHREETVLFARRRAEPASGGERHAGG